MSFFGFDPDPSQSHRPNAPGFGQLQDPFAGLKRQAIPDDDVLDFEETFDGLDDSGDAFNDDTFGAGGPNVGKDFDFSGQTDNVARAIEEERMRFAATRPAVRPASPPKKPAKPAKTGYERYIPKLEADASLWGNAPARVSEPVYNQMQQNQPGPSVQPRQMMSLEEVEAMMSGQLPPSQQEKQPDQQYGGLPAYSFPQAQIAQQYQASLQQQHPSGQPLNYSHPPHILQRPHPPGQQQQQQSSPNPTAQNAQQPQILQRPRQENQQPLPAQQQQPVQAQQPPTQPGQQPRHILQNPNRLSGPGQPLAHLPQQMLQQQHHNQGQRISPMPGHGRGPSYNGPVITNAAQILNLSEEDKAAFMQEEARRAKRNHKIHMMSKDNGLMTPQDKNFITRIQLQQLVTATGNIDAASPEAALDEDFYYQVYAQIRGASRQNPHQPASQFAHTYLFQTGGRYGMRRNMRHGDNHMQRMEQQVQRAIEAAKAKPKNKQLVVEGSLGKISFSNAKTPKPLLNFKRRDGDLSANSAARRAGQGHLNDAAADRRTILRNIENVYSDLMQMEDHERQVPPPPNENDAGSIQRHMEWRETLQNLNKKLWEDLKVMEPIVENSPVAHPFIAILCHPKGKKCIPRVMRHIDDNQRLTMITIITIHLDQLDVISRALPTPGATPDAPLVPPPLAVREEVELFAQTVMPSIFGYIGDAPLNIITGLLGLLIQRTTVPLIALTKIGLLLLTVLMSRAEVLRETSANQKEEWTAWSDLYTDLFALIEPSLPHVFPGSVVDADDVHVWQFLASMGVGASPDQQQRLVLGVKERVMETVGVSRTLPKEMGEVRLGNVNLFMRAIGLDVELLG
ncbi:topoisomerase ii associated protein [Venturia nashicola]|uniref:Topoisomerase ii associated protein n=1 Tax=Venturia nashicola TaxID=86259 RepID=A0A4Z1PJB7_9PEZI|nr:topoisomerase ii associated protein [Venturia nashicola]